MKNYKIKKYKNYKMIKKKHFYFTVVYYYRSVKYHKKLIETIINNSYILAIYFI